MHAAGTARITADDGLELRSLNDQVTVSSGGELQVLSDTRVAITGTQSASVTAAGGNAAFEAIVSVQSCEATHAFSCGLES